jgi:hypothetical protein
VHPPAQPPVHLHAQPASIQPEPIVNQLDGFPRNRWGHNRQADENPPKGLRYDGRDNWLGFKYKFMR